MFSRCAKWTPPEGPFLRLRVQGQFSDYITMVSFAEVNQDDALNASSTILNLFATSSAAVSLEVTRWDKTLLRVRYMTQHGSRMQMWQMETRAINAAIGIVALGLCRWVFPCSEAAGRDRQHRVDLGLMAHADNTSPRENRGRAEHL
jgi:hypothetical protein